MLRKLEIPLKLEMNQLIEMIKQTKATTKETVTVDCEIE